MYFLNRAMALSGPTLAMKLREKVPNCATAQPSPCRYHSLLIPLSQSLDLSSDQWSPAFMVPGACTVSDLPSDAHRHILPRVSTIAPTPPAALVSLDASQNWGSPSTHALV